MKMAFDLEQLQLLINTLPDLVWLKDLDGIYQMCNPRFEKFVGKKLHEIVGKTDFDLLPSDMALFFRQKDKEALEADCSLTNLEWITFSGDGHRELVETVKTPMRNNAGNIIGVLGISRDITARYQSEEALKESEKKYKYLFYNNPMPMWIYDIDSLGFVEVNKAAINHYGYSRNEFLSMTIKDIRPAEDVNKLLSDISKTTDELNNAGVWRHKKKSGEIIFVEVSSHAITIDQKKARLVLINDITERRKADQEVRKLHRAIEQSPVSIVITDVTGNIEYVNPKFSAITGYTPEEAAGKNPRFLRSESTVSEDYKNLWETISSGNEWRGEFINVDKWGKTFIESALVSPVYDENRNITHYVAVKEDITQRKKNEEDLSKFLLGIEESSDAIFITSIDGTIEYINPAFTRIYGYTREDAIGKTPRILKSGLVPSEVYREFWETLLAGKILKGEIRNRTKCGKIIDIEGSNSPIHNSKGKLMGFLSINRDITGRKNEQSELQHAKEKAEESDRLKTAFLHNISHEVRTPMNAILGFSSLLGEPDTQPDSMALYIESIQKSSVQLLSIISDIIDISEVMAKTSKTRIEIININELLEKQFIHYKPAAEEKNIILNLDVPLPDNNSHIYCDYSRLSKIVSNLVNNALKFTDAGFITMGYTLKGTSLEFFVSDTGIGIAEEYQSRIFDNFFQVAPAFSRVYEGTGLGLSICRAFTELLGGKIWVESIPGKGSKFSFTIPYSRADIPLSERKEPSISDSPKRNKKMILVAEDDYNNFKLIETYLSRLNISAIHASTGSEAVEIISNRVDINIILLDIRMPELNGFIAAARISPFSSPRPCPTFPYRAPPPT